VEAILRRLLAGEVDVAGALRQLQAERIEAVGASLRLDPDRQARRGVPEVVYAPSKTNQETAAAALALARAAGVALVSSVDAEGDAALRAAAAEAGLAVEEYGSGRRLRQPGWLAPGADLADGRQGMVAILAAGTGDVPVAEEARMVAETLGCSVGWAYDVGVAALHRLTGPLAGMVRHGTDAFVVVAGMEGALPSVVAGLVDAPVIAVPTSTGYGAGGGGLAALLGMLQTCSPGMTVVNVDNGIGAGAAAGLIATRAAAARRGAAASRPEGPPAPAGAGTA
jgi:NCAIR mutase (PurE)-related protein